MSIKSFEEIADLHSDRANTDMSTQPPSHSSKTKSNYIGMTLMEYFKVNSVKKQLEEIDEESNSSIGAGTPSFGELKDQINFGTKNKKHRRQKMKTQTQQELLPHIDRHHQTNISKISTINFDQITTFDKNLIKLPTINDHKRAANNSRQGMIKEGKIFQHRRQGNSNYKSKMEETASLGKEVGRIHENQRNALGYKKSIRARVTSTSFYHMNGRQRQRERIKTEEQICQKNLQKSFIVTKYGIGFMPSKKNREDSLQKQQNTIKLIKNTHH